MELASSTRRERHDPLEMKRLKSPALRAFLVQVFAVVCSIALAVLARQLTGYLIPFFALLAFQSITSALLAGFWGLEWWWLIIEFFFPIAVVVALYCNLPPVASLLLFLILFLVFGTTLRTRVPYYPSQATLPAAIINLLPANEHIHFLDVGSGFGGLVFDLARERPEWTLAGVEIAIFPWLSSALRLRFSGMRNIHFDLGKYEEVDFSKFNVVFTYLSPVVMPEIWTKVQNEMVPGSLFLSYEFSVPEVPAYAEILTAENAPLLYVWKI